MVNDQSNPQNTFQDLYEVVKTVRFGLSPNLSKQLDIEDKESSEHVIAKLVKSSVGIVEFQSKTDLEISEKDLIDKIENFIKLNKSQLELWKKAFTNFSKIELTKTLYKSLSQKAKFDYLKKDVGGSSIRMNGLQATKAEKISYYYKQITEKNFSLIFNFQTALDKYKLALEVTEQNHKKPNLVAFRKEVLSIINICFDWLKPLVNQEIKYLDSDFTNTSATRDNLFKFGNEIKDYFQKNGSLVPFGKVTLNYWTARQKPENFASKIKSLIEIDLDIKNLYEKLKNLTEEDLRNYFKSHNYIQINKYQAFLNHHHLTKIEQAQLFKPKPVRADVKFLLVERMKKDYNIDDEKLLLILNQIGQPIDIANDFKKWIEEDKKEIEDFDLNKYSLKLAFDYSWENLSKNLRSENEGKLVAEKFARSQSIALLESFGIVDPENDENLKFHSELSFIKEEIAIVEYQNKNNNTQERVQEAKNNIRNKFQEIAQKLRIRTDPRDWNKNYAKDRDNILSFINGDKNNHFQKSKENLGKLRGDLKNQINSYYKLTEKFKEIAGFLGRNFADLRDKLREENNINKISHFGVIVENNEEKYLLMLSLDKLNKTDNNKVSEEIEAEIVDHLDILDKKIVVDATDFTARKVVSLTSKTLNKILKNPGGYKNFHENTRKPSRYYYDNSKHLWIIDLTNKDVLDYVCDRLINSGMATDQKWQDKFSDIDNGFDWNEAIRKCKTYEQIEKVLDLKGYNLEEKYISKEDLVNLVTEKDCLLLPIINQDYQSFEKQDLFKGNKNQFTADFEKALRKTNPVNTKFYRLHPEFSIFYQLPSDKDPDAQKNHHAKILNRNSRFQLIGNFGIEIKPNFDASNLAKIDKFKNRKAKNELIRDKYRYQQEVDQFNKQISDDFQKTDSRRQWIYGFDRGINELATLCVLHKENKTIADFIVFKKEKVLCTKLGRIGEIIEEKKKNGEELSKKDQEVFRYEGFELQHILDLTNIKIETWHFADENHPNTKYLKQALSGIKEKPEFYEIDKKLGYFDKDGNIFESVKILVQYPEDESNIIKLRMNHFQRALSYAISRNRDGVANGVEEVLTLESEKEQVDKLFELGILDDTKIKIKIDKHLDLFKPLLDEIKEWNENKDKPNYLDEFKKKYEEIENLDSLKKGIVANMVGLTSFLMENILEFWFWKI